MGAEFLPSPFVQIRGYSWEKNLRHIRLRQSQIGQEAGEVRHASAGPRAADSHHQPGADKIDRRFGFHHLDSDRLHQRENPQDLRCHCLRERLHEFPGWTFQVEPVRLFGLTSNLMLIGIRDASWATT